MNFFSNLIYRYLLIINIKGIQVHLIAGIGIALATALSKTAYENYRIDRELVTWDYVKKHPQDFPEVFNRKKAFFFDLLYLF